MSDSARRLNHIREFGAAMLLVLCMSAPVWAQAPATPGTSNLVGVSASSEVARGRERSPGAVPSNAAPTALPSAAAIPSAAASAAAPAAPAVGVVPAALLTRDLSPWQMFLSADPVVKAVMILLAFASVLTWTVCLSKSLELGRAKRKVRSVLGTLDQASSLSGVAENISNGSGPAGELIAAAADEVKASAALSIEGIKERVAIRLGRIEVAARQTIARGTGLLATIGSVAPFVGLFGTVWGIMHSFIGISRAHTTNLAIVAPGIAEALMATAFGLIAAIPAVIIYNAFARSITGYRTLLEDVSAQVVRLVSRDLDQPREELPARVSATR
jgi:biopolymer transport protein ExbB